MKEPIEDEEWSALECRDCSGFRPDPHYSYCFKLGKEVLYDSNICVVFDNIEEKEL